MNGSLNDNLMRFCGKGNDKDTIAVNAVVSIIKTFLLISKNTVLFKSFSRIFKDFYDLRGQIRAEKITAS